MAYNFAARARRVAWSTYDEKRAEDIPHIQIQRVGTDSTLNDEDLLPCLSTSIQRFDVSEDVADFVNALRKDGCVIVENFTTSSSLQDADQEIRPWIETGWDEASEPSMPLIKQSPTLRNEFFANQIYQKLCEEFLTVEVTRRKNNRQYSEIRQPILSSTNSSILRTTSTVKNISRHDASLAVKHEESERYQTGRDAMLGMIIPGSSNNRVQAVLGSHLLGTSRPGLEDEVIEENLDVGQALIVLGSLFYQVTAAAEQQARTLPPLAHSLWSCAGVYRPEEQPALMISAAELRTYPQVVQERLR